MIHFENGALMVFEASWALNAPAEEETLVCGTKAVRETKYPMAQAVDMQKMLQAIYDSAASGKEILL